MLLCQHDSDDSIFGCVCKGILLLSMTLLVLLFPSSMSAIVESVVVVLGSASLEFIGSTCSIQ